MKILNMYAGCGGWSEGFRQAGFSDHGLEIWDHAINSSRAAGHSTEKVDLSSADPSGYSADVLVASPPCQTFSVAGRGEGRAVIDDLIAHIRDGNYTVSDFDERTNHVLVVGNWIESLSPKIILLEQVPPVRHIWNAYAERLALDGYSVWTGILNCADYGVASTRRRVFLIASLEGIASPPLPTHSTEKSLLLYPWVTIGDVLDRKNWTLHPGLTKTRNIRTYGSDEPAPTLTFGHDASSWKWISSSGILENFTPDDAKILQSFPEDYPITGPKTRKFLQISNSVPPRVAKAFASHLFKEIT